MRGSKSKDMVLRSLPRTLCNQKSKLCEFMQEPRFKRLLMMVLMFLGKWEKSVHG